MFIHLTPMDTQRRPVRSYTMYKHRDGEYVTTNIALGAYDPFGGGRSTLSRLGPVSKPHGSSIVTHECSACNTQATSDQLITHCVACGAAY